MKKINVYLINGFLGSGKTTTLLKCMEYFKGKNKKYAIILNELGETNIEKHLFKDESLYELLNGCVCCSIKEDLRTTLDELAETLHKENIEVVLLEGTGVANPSEIMETFNEKQYREVFEIAESICLIDSLHFTEYTSIFSSSKEVRQLQKEQIENGTVLVLNKVDQLSSKLAIEKVEKRIRKLNAEAPLLYSNYGNGVTEYLESQQKNSKVKERSISGHHHHHHHHHIKAMKVEQTTAMTKRELRDFLKSNQDKLLRAKGTIKNSDDQSWYHFQYASGLLEWQKANEYLPNRKGEIILIGERLSEKVTI
ncbi:MULTISPECIES: CobW family GTP-binding protein [Niallia]|uniref:GTP-binding protein n=1 Tax=Niallia circulans TaxID=1397 RepID=A0A941GCQ5_NIACI|nr:MULTISPECIES: GTP-binding protein [Niallia]MCB5238354.1 GTP-binding protein [Niallia circulans]MED3793884.1 GTP-binding protein [Niallia alba]